MSARGERLRQVRELHDRWVLRNLAGAASGFDPAAHPKPGSDYNQHHVDVDADGAAQDEFARAARRVLGLPGPGEGTTL